MEEKASTNIRLEKLGVVLKLDQFSRAKHHAQAGKKLAHCSVRLTGTSSCVASIVS